MNSRKAILGWSIILGVFVGGYLGSVYSEFLLGGLLYYVIDWAVSRRRRNGLIASLQSRGRFPLQLSPASG